MSLGRWSNTAPPRAPTQCNGHDAEHSDNLRLGLARQEHHCRRNQRLANPGNHRAGSGVSGATHACGVGKLHHGERGGGGVEGWRPRTSQPPAPVRREAVHTHSVSSAWLRRRNGRRAPHSHRQTDRQTHTQTHSHRQTDRPPSSTPRGRSWSTGTPASSCCGQWGSGRSLVSAACAAAPRVPRSHSCGVSSAPHV